MRGQPWNQSKEVTATSAIVPMIQNHTEDKRSLYGAHNLIIVSGKTTFGLFFDYPSELTFDIGYTRMDTPEGDMCRCRSGYVCDRGRSLLMTL